MRCCQAAVSLQLYRTREVILPLAGVQPGTVHASAWGLAGKRGCCSPDIGLWPLRAPTPKAKVQSPDEPKYTQSFAKAHASTAITDTKRYH